MNRRLVLLCSFLVGCLFSSVAQAQQNPSGRLPVASFDKPFLFLVRDPAVLAELNLSAQQAKDLTSLNDQP